MNKKRRFANNPSTPRLTPIYAAVRSAIVSKQQLVYSGAFILGISLSANAMATSKINSAPITPKTYISAPYAQEKSLVIIDSQLDDAAKLAASAPKNSKIYYLDVGKDGIEQISHILSQHKGLTSVHLLSHGGKGYLSLGSTILKTETLAYYQQQISGWSQSLESGADLMIYGCETAAGSQGAALLDQISKLTGADVAGSTDLTGSTAKGGDWDLEYKVGGITASTLQSKNYPHTLDFIAGDASGGGGGAGGFGYCFYYGPSYNCFYDGGGDGGAGGAGNDFLTGSATDDVIIGDGSGGGGAAGYYYGVGGAGGGGNDSIFGGTGDDILIGDGFDGMDGGYADYDYGGNGGLGGGGGGGGGNIFFSQYIGSGYAPGGNGGIGAGGGGAGSYGYSGAGGIGGGGGGGNYGYVGSGGGLGATDGSSGYYGIVGSGGGGGFFGTGGTGGLFFGYNGGTGGNGGDSGVGQGNGGSGSVAGPYGGAYSGYASGGSGGGGFGNANGGAAGNYINETETQGRPGGNGNTSVYTMPDAGGVVNASLTLATLIANNPDFGAGDDTLDGGAGSDELFGLGGADTFAFELDDATSGTDTDTVWDFDSAAGDLLAVSSGGTSQSTVDIGLAIAPQQVNTPAAGDVTFTVTDMTNTMTIVVKGIGRPLVIGDFDTTYTTPTPPSGGGGGGFATSLWTLLGGLGLAFGGLLQRKKRKPTK